MIAYTKLIRIDNVSRKCYSDVGVCNCPYDIKRSICDAQNRGLWNLYNMIEPREQSRNSFKCLLDIDEQALFWFKGYSIIVEPKPRYATGVNPFRLEVDFTKDFLYNMLMEHVIKGTASIDKRFLEKLSGLWNSYYLVAFRDLVLNERRFVCKNS